MSWQPVTKECERECSDDVVGPSVGHVFFLTSLIAKPTSITIVKSFARDTILTALFPTCSIWIFTL